MQHHTFSRVEYIWTKQCKRRVIYYIYYTLVNALHFLNIINSILFSGLNFLTSIWTKDCPASPYFFFHYKKEYDNAENRHMNNINISTRKPNASFNCRKRTWLGAERRETTSTPPLHIVCAKWEVLPVGRQSHKVRCLLKAVVVGPFRPEGNWESGRSLMDF